LTVLDSFKVFGIKPDLLIIAVVIASLIFNLKSALFLSASAGLFKDAFSASLGGINILLFVLWSFLIAKLSREITMDDNLIRAGLVLIIAILHNVICGAALAYSGNAVPLGIFLRIVFVASIYTGLVSLLAFKALKPIYP
jgi:rod shape-determining protein MreD